MMFLRQASPRRRFAAVTVPLSATAVLLTSAALLAGCGSGNGTAPYNVNSTATPTPLPTGFPTPLPTATPTPVPSGGLTPPFLGKVAFLSRRNASERSQVYVMNPDGSQVTELAPLTSYPSAELQYPGNHFMSADGSKFLLTYDFGTGAGAVSYLVNADGTNRRDITALLEPDKLQTGSQATGSVSDVSMNANGSVLVFGLRTFAFVNGADASTNSLITMNADGSARTVRYTTTPGADQTIGSPIFAPDGQTIYFLQSVQQQGINGFSGNVGGVYRLAVGATTPTQIAAFSTSSSTGAFVFPSLTINAAGTKLAFVNNADSSSNEIYSVNTDGTGLTKLTSNTFIDKSPAFTTDGAKIIFASNRDGNGELYSMNPDGSAQTRLTYNIELDEEPATRKKATR